MSKHGRTRAVLAFRAIALISLDHDRSTNDEGWNMGKRLSGEARSFIERTINDMFTKDSIQSVESEIETTFQGDEIISIFVTINDLFNDADREKKLGLVRHLRSRNSPLDEENFPIVSFISQEDAIKRKKCVRPT